MNGRTLEIEPGMLGYQQINIRGINAALNAWAKRRGIRWDGEYRRELMWAQSQKGKKDHGR